VDKKQVVARAAQVLSAIASHGSAGVRLLDLSRDTGIARPSVHRLLQELQEVGYVRQLETKRYALGSALFHLGLAAPGPVRDVIAVRRAAQKLSDICGDTVYVAIQQFNAAHYIVRTEGAYPIRAQSVNVGDTMPLTASYNGLVLLAQLDAQAREEHVARLEQDQVDEWRIVDLAKHEQVLRRALSQIDADGYVYGSDVVMPGLAGIAVPIPSSTGRPIAAVSISGLESRLPAEREPELLALLRATANEIACFID
jgi:DNA-binding IclR family transcriptional regulator